MAYQPYLKTTYFCFAYENERDRKEEAKELSAEDQDRRRIFIQLIDRMQEHYEDVNRVKCTLDEIYDDITKEEFDRQNPYKAIATKVLGQMESLQQDSNEIINMLNEVLGPSTPPRVLPKAPDDTA